MADTPYAQVKTNPRFERGWNGLQTSIQLAVTAIVVAGLAGVFGTGPLSEAATATIDGIVSVRYQRLLRRTVQTDMVVRLKQVPNGTASIAMPESFVQEMDIVSTSPRSSTMQVNAEGVSYLFDMGQASSGTITLSMKPKSAGLFRSRFRVGDHDVALYQFVWP